MLTLPNEPIRRDREVADAASPEGACELRQILSEERLSPRERDPKERAHP